MSTDLPQSILTTGDGDTLPLKRVAVTGTLRDGLAELTVTQHYLNPYDHNIEVVYTFPLPLGAVLLALELELGERRLIGSVVAKAVAEAAYEEAIVEGHSAVRVERIGPGLYSLSLGNLMSHESAVIRYRYGLPLRWQGDAIRLLLPTTLAPRYGDPTAAGLEPHQIPTSSLGADYPFELHLILEGGLAQSRVESPTHPLAWRSHEGKIEVSFTKPRRLSRDFVLLLHAAPEQTVLRFPGESAATLLAVLRLPPRPVSQQPPLNLKVVIDCSGSMAGVSIQQARRAALAILKQLRPDDRFNFTRFGSHYEHLWPEPLTASRETLAVARAELEQLEADRGGTEMGAALAAVYAMDHGSEASAILLITDGEVWDYEAIVTGAVQSGQRVFSVGVGLAVAEGVVVELARQSGGAYELLSPQEGMDERIVAQFERIRQPKRRLQRLDWGATPLWQSPLPESAYAGDTLHLYARLAAGVVTERVILQVEEEGGQPFTLEAVVTDSHWADLPRLAAAAQRQQPDLDPEAQQALALQYQLLTEQTDLLIVAKREEAAHQIPQLVPVPQMVPDGWLGLGTVGEVNEITQAVLEGLTPRESKVLRMRFGLDLNTDYTLEEVGKQFEVTRERIRSIEAKALRKLRHPSRSEKLRHFLDAEETLPETPLLLSPEAEAHPCEIASLTGLYPLLSAWKATLTSPAAAADLPTTLQDLAALGLRSEQVDLLRPLINDSWTEAAVTLAVWVVLSQHQRFEDEWNRDLKRVVQFAWQQLTLKESEELLRQVRAIVLSEEGL